MHWHVSCIILRELSWLDYTISCDMTSFFVKVACARFPFSVLSPIMLLPIRSFPLHSIYLSQLKLDCLPTGFWDLLGPHFSESLVPTTMPCTKLCFQCICLSERMRWKYICFTFLTFHLLLSYLLTASNSYIITVEVIHIGPFHCYLKFLIPFWMRTSCYGFWRMHI